MLLLRLNVYFLALPRCEAPKNPLTTQEHLMLIFNYPTKKALKESIGSGLNYIETSLFGLEYKDNGTLYGCNRPHITGHKREFFANVLMKDGKIVKVS